MKTFFKILALTFISTVGYKSPGPFEYCSPQNLCSKKVPCKDSVLNGRYQLKKWVRAHRHFQYENDPEPYIGMYLSFEKNGCIALGKEEICGLTYEPPKDTIWIDEVYIANWAKIYMGLQKLGWNKKYFDSGYHIFPAEYGCEMDLDREQELAKKTNSFFVGGFYLLEIMNEDTIIFTNGFADYLAVKN